MPFHFATRLLDTIMGIQLVGSIASLSHKQTASLARSRRGGTPTCQLCLCYICCLCGTWAAQIRLKNSCCCRSVCHVIFRFRALSLTILVWLVWGSQCPPDPKAGCQFPWSIYWEEELHMERCHGAHSSDNKKGVTRRDCTADIQQQTSD